MMNLFERKPEIGGRRHSKSCKKWKMWRNQFFLKDKLIFFGANFVFVKFNGFRWSPFAIFSFLVSMLQLTNNVLKTSCVPQIWWTGGLTSCALSFPSRSLIPLNSNHLITYKADGVFIPSIEQDCTKTSLLPPTMYFSHYWSVATLLSSENSGIHTPIDWIMSHKFNRKKMDDTINTEFWNESTSRVE